MSAASMTYTTLVADIENYAERSDDPFVSQIPRFIMMAENRIASECRGLGFQKYVTGSLSTNTLEKPTRWRETLSFSIVNGTEQEYLKLRGYEYCRAYAPDSSVTGTPKYYANYNYEHFFIAPSPDASYDFELAYYERPTPLDDDNQTSWTTQYAPQLLLYACLLETAPFLKNQDKIATWQGLYDRAKEGVHNEALRSFTDRAGYKDRT